MNQNSPIPYISPEDVIYCVGRMEQSLKTELGAAYSVDHRKVAAAVCVFAMYFGHDWMRSRMGNNPFIRPPLITPLDYYKTSDRIVALAEHLVNLQEVAGFQWCLDET
jgi:hypothetical protein